jgi:hypothetical protein
VTSSAPEDERDAAFASAWTHIDRAAEQRRVLAECWSRLCESCGFHPRLSSDEAGGGRLEVLVEWPHDTLQRADRAATQFASHVKAALDEAILAAADEVSGARVDDDPDRHRMPLCRTPDEFAQLLEDMVLAGLRPDQVRVVELFQPFDAELEESNRFDVRPLMRHLAEMLRSDRDERRPRVAVWAHSANPMVRVDPPGTDLPCESTGDGVLERVRTVATFTLDDPTDIARGQGNPNIAFDLIFNDHPLPAHPDDTLVARSAGLLAAASEFVRGMERSVGARTDVNPWPPAASVVRATDATPWSPLDADTFVDGPEVASMLKSSDFGLAIHQDVAGNTTMLVKVAGTVFCRPIPSALPLDTRVRRGTAAEDATLAAASRWGLPDFVMRPAVIAKGKATREVGDGTIITGRRAVSVQVKSRETPSDDAAREERWVQKKAAEGARQAQGTVRSLRSSTVDLVNGRGRVVPCDGSEFEWAGVVIIDHPSPPPTSVAFDGVSDVPIVVLLRRDWDFLFDQLRSVSAVVDYIHRIASDGPTTLGEESVRYFELAQADEDAVGEPAPGPGKAGAMVVSHPLLPKAPASSLDTTGHTVFRILLEEIARIDIDRDERDRLALLASIDRFSVGDRAALGRLLLDHLDAVTAAQRGTTMWRFRRVVQDKGALHLAFGACNQYTEVHRQAFQGWAMLRHHELHTAQAVPSDKVLKTVAVLLTPRYGDSRPWDTSVVSIEGALDVDPEELAALQKLWNGSGNA